MKICKVKITKEFDGTICHNIYPEDYDANIMNVISYEEKPLNTGKNTGYCIATVPDDFEFTDDMVEINKAQANAFIDAEADKETGTAFDSRTGQPIDLKEKYKKRKLL
jgi:hypothetical protein